MSDLTIEKVNGIGVKVTKNGESIEAQTVEANLLYAILEKLEEIRCGIIDVECAVEKNGELNVR